MCISLFIGHLKFSGLSYDPPSFMGLIATKLIHLLLSLLFWEFNIKMFKIQPMHKINRKPQLKKYSTTYGQY